MNLGSFIRIVFFVAIAWIGGELLLKTEAQQWAIVEYPYLGIFVVLVLVFAIAVEASIGSLKNILYLSLSEEAREHYDAQQEASKYKWQENFEVFMQKMTKSKEIEEEETIILDHNYDGIKELDNRLPPWWIYGFYLTIVFAVVYLIRFHVVGDYKQAEEYQREVAQAKVEIEAYLATVKDIINVDNVVFLEDASDLAKGEKMYTHNCVACHRADGGGGIGPNLTDEHWILGGGIKNVFNTISEGGRAGKGMVAWKTDLSDKEMQQVASYVLTLQENNPEDGKAPEGDVWTEEE